MQRGVGVARLQRALDGPQLVADLLEPQLVDLVDDDEQQLVVLGAIRPGDRSTCSASSSGTLR